MLKIPLGRTRTYSEIATSIGAPNATRAVGNACGANPIPVLVPCHRVTASGGKLGGFSGGLDWKRRLLAVEKVELFSTEAQTCEDTKQEDGFAFLRLGISASLR